MTSSGAPTCRRRLVGEKRSTAAKAAVPFHDRIVMQAAPFDGTPVELAKTSKRSGGILWGDGGFAMLIDREWKTRTEHRYAIAPDRPGERKLLLTRNYQDQYGDPGVPIREANAAGKLVMRFTADHQAVFVRGEGATKAGAFPFLATLPLAAASRRGGGPQRRLITNRSSRCSTIAVPVS